MEKGVESILIDKIQNYQMRNQLKGLQSYCAKGSIAILKRPNGCFQELKKFRLCDEFEAGKLLGDGSIIYVKYWMNMITVINENNESYSYLTSIPACQCFGFPSGPVNWMSELDEEKKLESKKDDKISETNESYFMDNDRYIVYHVKEFIFRARPKDFDPYDGEKDIVICQGKKQLWFMSGGKSCSLEGRALINIHPLANCLIR